MKYKLSDCSVIKSMLTDDKVPSAHISVRLDASQQKGIKLLYILIK